MIKKVRALVAADNKSEILVAGVLWALLGGIIAAALSALTKQIEQSRRIVAVLALASGLVGLTRPLLGRVGIPIMGLIGGLLGFFLGYSLDSVTTVAWQIGAAGVIAGSAGGVFFALRLAERFHRKHVKGNIKQTDRTFD